MVRSSFFKNNIAHHFEICLHDKKELLNNIDKAHSRFDI